MIRSARLAMSGIGSDPFSLDEEIGGEAETPSPAALRPQPVTVPSPAAPAPRIAEPPVTKAPAPKPTPPSPAPEIAAAKAETSKREAAKHKVRRGRPKLENPKKQITLRLDADVVAHYRATGRGWQTRINEALRQSSKLGGSQD
ncbi:MAG: BrnA antitoxin family protein [Pseudomonadota bacterium]